MEKKNGCARVGFSTILWGVLVVLLCAAPCSWAVDITEPTDGPYYAEGEVNVYADITYGLFANPGSTVNIYAGAIGDGLYFGITVSPDSPLAVVTVYGTNFGGDGDFSVPGQVSFTEGAGTLTGKYEDGNDINLMFMSDVPIYLAAPGGGEEPQIIEIDIKPGSDLNPINPGSNGLIPVAILTTDDFNAADVDPATVTLAGAEVAVRGKAEKLMARLEDIDGDGDNDLLLQVETQSEGALWESGTVALTGKTYDGQNIEGTDEVIIVPPEG